MKGRWTVAMTCAAVLWAPAASAQDDFRTKLRAGVERLQFLKGDWRGCMRNADKAGGWGAGTEKAAHFRPSLNDLYLETEMVSGKYRYIIVFSYDHAQGRYRIASRDDQSGLIDIYDGDFGADGALVVSNVGSGTHYAYKGVKYFNRMSFLPTSGGWSMIVEASNDRGASWKPQTRFDAWRDGAGSAPSC